MTRLAIDRREDLPADRQHFYDRILRSRGRVTGPYSVLLNTPDVAERITRVGDFLLYESILAPRVKYLAMLLAARALDCDYAWEAVLPHALRAGVPRTLTDTIGGGETPQELTAEDALVVRFSRKLLGGNHHVDEQTYRSVVEHFGVPAAAQIAYTVGYTVMIALIANAFEVEHDPGEQELVL